MVHMFVASLVVGVLAGCGTTSASRLRSTLAKQVVFEAKEELKLVQRELGLAQTGDLAWNSAPEEVEMKVVNKTSFEEKGESECLCPIGEFWHWRIHQCIKQGGWGYECGFFPAEHHRLVCQDNMKCQKVEGTGIKYVHRGAVPASCRECTAEDKCKTGEERRAEECIKTSQLSGKACATVSVSLAVSATEKATATETVKATATAKATGSATEKASVTVTSEKTAKATKEGSAKVTAKAESSQTKTVEGEKDGIVAQVKVEGPAAKASASETVKAKATAEATGEASKKATATATVEKEHEHIAEAEATAKAEAEASASVDALSEETRCVDVAAAKEHLGLKAVADVGPVLAASITAAGDKLAFDAAYSAALEAAQKTGRISASEAAKSLAASKASADAKLKAAAEAADKAAWKAEAGAKDAAEAEASDAAKDAAKDKAAAKAQIGADANATSAAKANAKEEAAAKADAAAAEAGKDVKDDLQKKADAEAKAKAEDKPLGWDALDKAQKQADAAASAASQAVADQASQAQGAGKTPENKVAKDPNTNPPRKVTEHQMKDMLP